MVINRKKWLIGIDEAGRGPLAGPVAVGVVKVMVDFDWDLIEGVGDSKNVSPKKREIILRRAKQLKKEGELDFVVVMGSVQEIETKGIAVVIRDCIEKGIKKLKLRPEECFIKLDGSLRAPTTFDQETIIKGDSKESVIGLASICAKETRDEYMKKVALNFPKYKFDIHKGYGTKEHRRIIHQEGLSEEHRASYCQNSQAWGTV
jgi:ribonuclease HII